MFIKGSQFRVFKLYSISIPEAILPEQTVHTLVRCCVLPQQTATGENKILPSKQISPEQRRNVCVCCDSTNFIQ